MGWDGIDELKANVRGWEHAILSISRSTTIGSRASATAVERPRWAQPGRAPIHGLPLLVPGAASAAPRPKEPAALAMITGFAGAALRREPQCPDADVRAYLRDQQRVSAIPQRMRETLARH